MPRVIVGYGDYKGYQLAELPAQVLTDLAARYPLHLEEQPAPEYDELLITVAIHAELQRREAGGKPEQRVPTLRELREEIITRGYQQASKQHHPDTKGHHEAQIRLTQARDQLRNSCNDLADENDDQGATIVPAPPPIPTPAPTRPRPSAAPSDGITDDDVPF
jgi:hypothetical protein